MTKYEKENRRTDSYVQYGGLLANMLEAALRERQRRQAMRSFFLYGSAISVQITDR